MKDREQDHRLGAYEPPRVISEETFETLSLSCGKTDPSIPTCNPAEEPPGSLSGS